MWVETAYYVYISFYLFFVTQSPRNTSFVTLSEQSIGKACFH